MREPPVRVTLRIARNHGLDKILRLVPAALPRRWRRRIRAASRPVALAVITLT